MLNYILITGENVSLSEPPFNPILHLPISLYSLSPKSLFVLLLPFSLPIFHVFVLVYSFLCKHPFLSHPFPFPPFYLSVEFFRSHLSLYLLRLYILHLSSLLHLPFLNFFSVFTTSGIFTSIFPSILSLTFLVPNYKTG